MVKENIPGSLLKTVFKAAKFSAGAAACCLLFLSPASRVFGGGVPVVYTVQVSSSSMQHLEGATEIAEQLGQKGFSEARVELIGSMYAVRTGAYENREEAEAAHERIRDEFPDSFVRTGYYLPERIVYPETSARQEGIKESGGETPVKTTRKAPPPEEALKPAPEENTASARADSVPAPEKQPDKSADVVKEVKQGLVDTLMAKNTRQEETESAVKEKSKTSRKSKEEKKNRLEINFSEDYLTPHDSYGSWRSLGLVYRRKHSEDIKFLIQSSLSHRDGFGDGVSLGAGVFKNWTPRLYTYSSISSGTNEEFHSRISLGHTFYFKPGGGHIIPLGFSFRESRSGGESYSVSSGIIKYVSGGWVYEYYIKRSRSEPGGIGSFSHKMGINKGKEGRQWVRLGLSFGKWAYLLDDLVTPEEIDQDSFRISLSWRKWLGEHYGIKTEIGYFTLEDGYDKYGADFGIFTEF